MSNYYSDSQLSALIRCANILENSPFEAYVMGFVYPEIIDQRDTIPTEFLSNRLKTFKQDLIAGRIDIPQFVTNLDSKVKNKIINPQSRELLTYAKVASDSLSDLKIEQVEDLIKCANMFEGSNYECYVMKCIYPEIINSYCGIPESLISNKLVKFREDLINNEIDALQLFVKLKNSHLSPEHLAYYYIIKESMDRINPCIMYEAKDLLEIKQKEADNKILELSRELNTVMTLRSNLSKVIGKHYCIEQAVIRTHNINQKDMIRLTHELDANSSFKAIMDLPQPI